MVSLMTTETMIVRIDGGVADFLRNRYAVLGESMVERGYGLGAVVLWNVHKVWFYHAKTVTLRFLSPDEAARVRFVRAARASDYAPLFDAGMALAKAITEIQESAKQAAQKSVDLWSHATCNSLVQEIQEAAFLQGRDLPASAKLRVEAAWDAAFQQAVILSERERELFG